MLRLVDYLAYTVGNNTARDGILHADDGSGDFRIHRGEFEAKIGVEKLAVYHLDILHIAHSLVGVNGAVYEDQIL